jgi:hypothetical protein
MAAKKGPQGKCPPTKTPSPPKSKISQVGVKGPAVQQKDAENHLRGPRNNIYVFG